MMNYLSDYDGSIDYYIAHKVFFLEYIFNFYVDDNDIYSRREKMK
jgi:hypothetical protein